MRVTLLPFFLFVFAFSAMMPVPAHAGLFGSKDKEKKEETAEAAEEDKAKLSKAERVTYYPVTRATLSQLFWAMGAYSTDNDIDVDNFMLLNRCDLYKEHYRNDFVWHKIRVKAKASLEKNMEEFPTRFKMVQPIWLKRYNFGLSAFPLAQPFYTSRFELEASDTENWSCKKYASSRNVWKYPAKAIITFSTPLEIENVDVTPQVASLYNNFYSDVHLHKDRPAYIVIYFKVFEANPVPQERGYSTSTAKIGGVVEKVDFFADVDLTLHLSTLDFRRRNKSRFSGSALDKKD